MVNSSYVSRLVNLIKQGVIAITNIKITEYTDAVITSFKSEVVNEIITIDKYKEYTGQDYIA